MFIIFLIVIPIAKLLPNLFHSYLPNLTKASLIKKIQGNLNQTNYQLFEKQKSILGADEYNNPIKN